MNDSFNILILKNNKSIEEFAETQLNFSNDGLAMFSIFTSIENRCNIFDNLPNQNILVKFYCLRNPYYLQRFIDLHPYLFKSINLFIFPLDYKNFEKEVKTISNNKKCFDDILNSFYPETKVKHKIIGLVTGDFENCEVIVDLSHDEMILLNKIKGFLFDKFICTNENRYFESKIWRIMCGLDRKRARKELFGDRKIRILPMKVTTIVETDNQIIRLFNFGIENHIYY